MSTIRADGIGALALLALLVAGCRPLPVPSPEQAAEAPPPPGAVRVFGIERPLDTAAPVPPPRLLPR